MKSSKQNVGIKPLSALIDLILFLGVMFLVREVYIEFLGFWGNALFKSFATVGVATVLLYYRQQSWKDLGLTKPKNYLRSLGVAAIILVGTLASLMIFELFLSDLIFGEVESSAGSGISRLKDDSDYLIAIVLFVWIESFLEELQDRGFSLNRFNSLFGKIPLATALAVVSQAVIFGFRHSYDFSPRSITTGLIGLIFGIIYVLTGRNLWPLILAHILLNTMSFLG